MSTPVRSSPARRGVLWLWAMLLALGWAIPAHAGLNQWTTGGPPNSLVRALAVDPLSPLTVYAGSNGTGIFKSINGGISWASINTGLANLQVNALAITPQVPTTVYAGTTGSGVFRSTDGGMTWASASLGLTNLVVTALAIDTQSFAVLYAGTNGTGVFRSFDGGASWAPAGVGITNAVITSLAVDPQAPTTIYAGTFGVGVFKSTDGGSSWVPMNSGLFNSVVTSLAVDPRTPLIVYAGTTGGGVFKSENGGQTWLGVNNGLFNLNVTALAINPQSPSTLYAGTNGGGVFTTSDRGASWMALNAGLSNTGISALTITLTGTCLHAGTGSGVFDFATFDNLCSPAPPIPPAGFVNISTRGFVGTGDDVMIGGFIITGTQPRRVLVRAVGPSLADFGVQGALGDPFLRIFSGQTPIAENDSWVNPLPLCQACESPTAIAVTGLNPRLLQEAAILITLSPGPYTAIVSGAGGATGVALVEVFDLGLSFAPSRLVNISTRGLVGTGDQVMIGGFVIGGTLPMKVLIRSAGPSLASFGVPGVLSNPALQIFAAQTLIAANDDWQQQTVPLLSFCLASGHTCGSPSEIAATGLAPSNALEAAILITLTPGAYTGIVSGVGGATGVGMIEVFEID